MNISHVTVNMDVILISLLISLKHHHCKIDFPTLAEYGQVKRFVHIYNGNSVIVNSIPLTPTFQFLTYFKTKIHII